MAPKDAKDDTVTEGGAPPDPNPPVAEAPPISPAEQSAATDKQPKKKPGRPKGSKNKPKTGTGEKREPTVPAGRRKLTKQLDGFLKGPALVFEAVGEEWPASHVDKAATPLAESLASYAEKNPVFQARLEAFFEGGATAQLIVAGAMYVLPLGMYFGVIPAPERVRVMMNVPEKPGRISVQENGIPGSWEAVPEEIRTQVETEARDHGFILADGSADVNRFMAAMNDAVSQMRSQP